MGSIPDYALTSNNAKEGGYSTCLRKSYLVEVIKNSHY